MGASKEKSNSAQDELCPDCNSNNFKKNREGEKYCTRCGLVLL